VTLAVRGLHLGRYGGNADSLSSIGNQQNFGAVQPLYVGFPTLVRGYDVYSGNFQTNECGTTAAIQDVCPAFQRLFGSRVAVLNAELTTAVAMTTSTGRPSAVSTASATMRTAPRTSSTTISRTRSYRSATTPPYGLNKKAGTILAMVAAPTQAGDPVSSKIQTARATL